MSSKMEVTVCNDVCLASLYTVLTRQTVHMTPGKTMFNVLTHCEPTAGEAKEALGFSNMDS